MTWRPDKQAQRRRAAVENRQKVKRAAKMARRKEEHAKAK